MLKSFHSLDCLPALALFVSLVANSPSTEIADLETGYTLSLPEGWERIPDDALKQVSDALGGGAIVPNFIAAFGPASRNSYFQYPYALVQVHHYGNGLSLATISRQELEEMVSNLTGVPPSELTAGLPETMTKLIRSASLDSPRVITTPPGFMLEAKVDYQEAGAIRGSTIGIIGRTNAVFLHFYGKESERAEYTEALEHLASGFGRTQDQRVEVGEVTRTATGRKLGGGFDWDRIRAKAVAGLVLGALFGAVGMARKRSNQTAQDKG